MADTLIQGTTIIEDKRRGVGEVLSIPGAAFLVDSAGTFDFDEQGILDINSNIHVVAPVILPNGVTVKNVVVYGSNVSRTWFLYRSLLTATTGKSTMATAIINTEDDTISNAIIDNNLYKYWLQNEAIGTETVNGARIKYTF